MCEIFPCLPLKFLVLGPFKKNTDSVEQKNRHGHKKQNQRLLYSTPWHGHDGHRASTHRQVEHIGSSCIRQLKKRVEIATLSWMLHILDAFAQIFLGFLGFPLFFAGVGGSGGVRKKASRLESPSMCSTDHRKSAVSTILRRNTSVSCSISAAESFRIGSIEPTYPLLVSLGGIPGPLTVESEGL